MSQEVKIAGALFSNVPSIQVPDSNNVYHSFVDTSDTTAAAADVASGKYFYTAAGVRTAGTSSGGGGSSNCIQGTFTTGSTRNTTGTFTIPYTGTGYPIALMVFIKNGAYNNSSTGDTTWYNSVNRYDVGVFYMSKSRTDSAPTYENNGAENYGVTAIIYKNSTSNSNSYTRASQMSAITYNSSTANAETTNGCIRFKGNGKTVSYFVGNASGQAIGFPPSTDLQYIAIYSS